MKAICFVTKDSNLQSTFFIVKETLASNNCILPWKKCWEETFDRGESGASEFIPSEEKTFFSLGTPSLATIDGMHGLMLVLSKKQRQLLIETGCRIEPLRYLMFLWCQNTKFFNNLLKNLKTRERETKN